MTITHDNDRIEYNDITILLGSKSLKLLEECLKDYGIKNKKQIKTKKKNGKQKSNKISK
jgi:hypothetical protein